jgi:Protein of unknown function (DUF732)
VSIGGVQLKHMVGVLVAVVGSAVAFAAPAAADVDAYLQTLQPRYVYLSAEQLLSVGAKICHAAGSGVPSSETTTMVRNDLGVSVSTAAEIVSAAVVDLDC